MKFFHHVVYFTCVFICSSVNSENCRLIPLCNYFPWLSWSSCTGGCGMQTSSRVRALCCPSNIKILDDCIQFCNVSQIWNETKACVVCLHGILDPLTQRCLCPSKYTGRCCQDKITCKANPCRHGECENTYNGFMCYCNKGYKGERCDIPEGDWTSWGPFGPCNTTCGTGYKTRTRICNGTKCPGETTDSIMCDSRKLCSVNGEWGQWSEYGICSKSCGQGLMTRVRYCTKINSTVLVDDAHCAGDFLSTISCNMHQCLDRTIQNPDPVNPFG